MKRQTGDSRSSGVARNLRQGVRNCVVFCCAMLCKRGISRHVVCFYVCPSVTFVDSVKTNNHIVKFFSPFYTVFQKKVHP